MAEGCAKAAAFALVFALMNPSDNLILPINFDTDLGFCLRMKF